jgi:hypothetical protein
MNDQKIATYTFLPWLRQGINSKISQPDTLALKDGPKKRAAVKITMQAASDRSEVDPLPVEGEIQILGPGDVIGINPRAIFRTEPRNWVTDFEPNYLAFIEFYFEDFPWRFTPARAVEISGGLPGGAKHTKLRPWLYLIVLEEGEDQPLFAAGPLPAIALTDQSDPNHIFPPAEQAWAWAHVHVSRDVTNEGASTASQTVRSLENLVRQNPDEAYSRLLCPRKLKPLTGYHAYLIPAFEVGRLAGLGLPTTGVDTLAASWGSNQNEYPVYYQWYFRTGERGDFESLVDLLEARPVDERVGIRNMDMQKKSFNVPGIRDELGEQPVMGLEGALKSPQARSRPDIWPPPDPDDYPALLTGLETQVNLQDTLLEPPPGIEVHPDPVISPPLYGRWHAGQKRLEVGEAGWVNELNQDPRLRVPAGFGTEVIQNGQEGYMQRAWQQLGDVLRANQKIRQLQLSIASSQAVFTRFLEPLPPEEIIAVTHQVHTRILGSPTTIRHQVKASRLPQAALRATFRRLTRPRGAMMRKLAPADSGKPADMLTKLNTGQITAAPPKVQPANQISLADAAAGLLPDWIPDWLKRILLWHYTPWLLALTLGALMLINLVLAFSPAAAVLGMLGAGSAAVGIWIQQRARLSEQISETLTAEKLTPEQIQAVAPRPNFRIMVEGQAPPPGSTPPGDEDSPDAANFRSALLDLHARFRVPLPEQIQKIALDFSKTKRTLLQALKPVNVIPTRFERILAIPDTLKYPSPFRTPIPVQVMAHPIFRDAMYKPLRDISTELLIPNLNLILNNSITLMETNPKFIEAYMVGLNHEMASELLWRTYMTDQRGSYFRQFWDVSEIVNRDPGKDAAQLEEDLSDIRPLHSWGSSTDLGTHENRPLPRGGAAESKLVLVVRGDLFKKYPSTIIFAQKAKWVDDEEDDFLPPRKIRVLDEAHPQQNRKDPIFKAEVEPDIKFIGFDLTASIVKGDPKPPETDGDPGDPGWFFVLQQRPGEPRFGMDIVGTEALETQPTEWNELTWNHLGPPDAVEIIDLSVTQTLNADDDSPDKKITWGSNAADMAYILFQAPVMVAVHAADMLDLEKNDG